MRLRALTSVRLTPARPLLVPTQSPGGGSTSAQPWAPSSGLPTPRGWGSTGQGSCVLHEPTTHVEYPHPFSSSTRPSCSRRPDPADRAQAASTAHPYSPPAYAGLTQTEQWKPYPQPLYPRMCGADWHREYLPDGWDPLPPRARG